MLAAHKVSPRSINEKFYIARIDQKLSEKDQMHLTYLQTPSELISPDATNFTVQAQETKRNTASMETTHTFGSSFVNVASQHGMHQPFRANDVNVVPPSLTPDGVLWPAVASHPKS